MLAPSERLPSIGGAEVQQAIVIRELDARGFDIIVVTRDFGQPRLVKMGRAIEVVKTCPEQAGLRVLRQIHPRATSLWRCLLRADADIYYQRGASINTGLVALFCRLHARRFVFALAHDLDISEDGLLRNRTKGALQSLSAWRDKRIFDFGFKRAALIIAQNKEQQSSIAAIHDRPSIIVPSSYRLSLRDTRVRELILWVARLVTWKRPELFIDLAARFPDHRFVLVGGTADADYLMSLRERAAQHCDLTGFLPYEEAERYFDRARVFVNTSQAEGFPNSFLQAWARGVPVLSSVDPSASIARHQLGFHCASLDEFEVHLRQLLNDEQLYESTSKRCLTHFEAHHSLERIGDQYEQVFTELCAS